MSAEKYSGIGDSFIDLFLIDNKYNVIAITNGEYPKSMCFTINKVDYEGNTIVFGAFNDSKWIPKQGTKINVQINKIDVKFSNNQNIKEDMVIEKGYIVVLNSISKVEQFNIYNEKNELQSSIEDLEEYGRIINETQFREVKGK